MSERIATAAGVKGDRPLTEDDDDLLGFTEMAEQLANALVDRASKDGIVVGIEGEWGSGKSSMLALTTRALRKLPEDCRPVVLSFQPWLIGNRDALLTSLFDELARTMDAVHLEIGDATRSRATAIKDLSDRLRKYGNRLGSLAPIASIASMAGVPWTDRVARLLERLKNLSDAAPSSKPLAEAKKEINDDLAALPRRIVVLIDDVDRLEPIEIAEILRLVRSVADFQNVVYVLCYDQAVVAEAIQTAMHVPDGRAYLEKIVQVAVRVPAPEPFVLRRMFAIGLSEFAGPDNEDTERRLASVIDQDGGTRLTTPRSVNRTLDALRFFWPSLRGKVDLADLVWLQLVRMTNPALYSWIEEYTASMAAIASGRASVSEEARARSFTDLEHALGRDQVTFEQERWRLAEFLPGIWIGIAGDEDRPPLFRQVPEEQRLAAVNDKRLASPDHHRLYFALSMPTGAPRATDFLMLWEAADSGHENVKELLRSWFEAPSSGIGNKAEIMLDRLRGVPEATLNGPRSTNVLLALADVLDEPAAIGARSEWGGPASWREAEDLLPILRDRMGADAQAYMMRAFREGRAIGWLVHVLRSETFAHGRYGDRRRPESEWLFTEVEYDAVVEVMHERFVRMTMSDVLATPDPMSLLFAWHQSGGAEEARALVEASTKTDAELVRALDHMATSIRTSAEGEHLVIRRSSLGEFLDADDAYRRIVAIGQGEGELASRAATIKQRFDRARDF